MKEIEEYRKMKKLEKHDTFCFQCDGCGECCKNRDDILLTAYDILRIRKYLAVSMGEFIDTYCDLYIGPQSKLPLVRLRPAALCVFLMHGKCLVHEAKPTVCVLFPLGRIVERKEDSYKMQYFFQDISCGTKKQENVVEDWIQSLGSEHEECARLWHSMMNEAVAFIQQMPEVSEETERKLAATFFELLYEGYDYDEDYVPQFRQHLEVMRSFLHIFKVSK